MRHQHSTSSIELSKSTQQHPFSIRRFPSFDTAADDVYTRPCRHKSFEIVWIEKGNGRYFLDTVQAAVEPLTVCFAQPGQVHQLVENEPMQGYIISFTEEFLCLGETEFDLFYQVRHFQVFASHPAILLGNETALALKEIISKMLEEDANDLAFKQEVMRRYLKIFFLYLARHCSHYTTIALPARQTALVERFTTLVDQHYLTMKMVTDYAAMLSITPNYLNDTVKQVTGHSAGHHIRQRILMEVKRQAIYTHASMKEIAYSLGFFDPAHFSKYFKKITGINFTAFKQTLSLPVMQERVNL
ncbi:MAG TPA: helix-turn-helix transcriptional regulator [Chitinophagaceae bacterium]|nr:helix-turn-helix transcriptional regulator [Chitinophagaceae bacterium]